MSKASELTRLVRLARPLAQEVEAATALMLSETGLTVRMRAVLEVLQQNGPLTVPDVGRKMGIQRQYVQLMMNEVVKAKLARRIPNPIHKRSHLFELTEGGAGVLTAIANAEERVMEEFAANLSRSEIEMAVEVTEHVLGEYHKLNADLQGD